MTVQLGCTPNSKEIGMIKTEDVCNFLLFFLSVLIDRCAAVPLGWAVDPNLKERFPVVFDYIFNSLQPNDRLITGDSGAGYVNPTQLFVPRQISGTVVFVIMSELK